MKIEIFSNSGHTVVVESRGEIEVDDSFDISYKKAIGFLNEAKKDIAYRKLVTIKGTCAFYRASSDKFGFAISG